MMNQKNILDTFDNPNIKDDYLINMDIPEFTCLCPLTGQPDFARFEINYVPDKKCVELKSLKLYMASYRDIGAFHEDNTNQVLRDISTLIKPRFISITGYDTTEQPGGLEKGEIINSILGYFGVYTSYYQFLLLYCQFLRQKLQLVCVQLY